MPRHRSNDLHHKGSLPIGAAAATLAARLPRLALAAQEVSQHLVMGPHGQRKSGTGEAFWQYRPFNTGDPAGDIDWRQSARSDNKLFVRETEWESAATLWVWCDIGPGMHYASRKDLLEKVERAVIISTAITLAALKADETVRFLTPTPHKLKGHQNAAHLIEKLFEDHEKEQRLPTFPPEAKNRHCLLVSDFYRPIEEIQTVLLNAAAQGLTGHVAQVVDPAELTFPFKGRIRFRPPQRDTSRLFGDVSEIKDSYKASINSHSAALEHQCRDIGWFYTRHETDKPAISAVLPLIQGMNTSTGGQL